jgi:signal transduction histidine kinase
MNIIMNASQACGDAGLIIVRTFSDSKGVYIEIEDNGTGIREEHLTDIFSPFFTTKPLGKGTGLGLSISYKIISEDHGGRLEVKSCQKGSVFRISLPLAKLAYTSS